MAEMADAVEDEERWWTCCGRRVRRFHVIAAVAFVLVVSAAVVFGASLGFSLAVRNENNNDNESSTSSSVAITRGELVGGGDADDDEDSDSSTAVSSGSATPTQDPSYKVPTMTPTVQKPIDPVPSISPKSAAPAPASLSPTPLFRFDEDPFRFEDPFPPVNVSDLSRWRTNNTTNSTASGGSGASGASSAGGLELQVHNALAEHWYPFFDQAIADWNKSASLRLNVTIVDADDDDPSCESELNIVKVCNGNYGATQWKGISEVLLSNKGFIFSSTVRINDFYFEEDNNSTNTNTKNESAAGATTTIDDFAAQRQYTMCHEFGHAFGLPHSDENFFNADLGNCMDYTNNYEVNMRPDDSLFQILVELYGVFP